MGAIHVDRAVHADVLNRLAALCAADNLPLEPRIEAAAMVARAVHGSVENQEAALDVLKVAMKDGTPAQILRAAEILLEFKPTTGAPRAGYR